MLLFDRCLQCTEIDVSNNQIKETTTTIRNKAGESLGKVLQVRLGLGLVSVSVLVLGLGLGLGLSVLMCRMGLRLILK